MKDANRVSENVGQEKEEINEGGSSQSVVEVQLYISKEQNIFKNKKNMNNYFQFSSTKIVFRICYQALWKLA